MGPRVSALLGATLLVGCAGVSPPGLSDRASMFADPRLDAAQAQAALHPGQSTKAEVAARLGAAQVLVFDSGYEVWAYRAPARRGQGGQRDELVLLFGPDGVLRKHRFRAAPAVP